MLRAIIGIDEGGSYLAVLNLLARLKIAETEVEVVHADETHVVDPRSEFGYVSDPEIAQIDFDEALLSGAEALAKEKGWVVNKTVLSGPASKVLVEHAGHDKVDLICIGSRRRSKFNSSLFGSMGRSVTISANQSILLSKGNVDSTGDLVAVLAVDHSKYADQAVEKLTQLRPLGIKRLVVITAIEGKFRSKTIDKAMVEEYLDVKSKKIVEVLHAAGLPAEHRIVWGDLSEVLEDQLHSIHADLLILGAQGHGYSGRNHIGSSALKQVVACKQSVLLLRV